MTAPQQNDATIHVDEKTIDIDHEKNQVAHTAEEVDLTAYHFTEAESRALARKFDIHILPFIWFCYLFNSLDRGNVSNAKSDGFANDLKFPYNGYTILLSVFFTFISVMAVPGVMLSRKVGVRWTIPGYMFGWGAMALLNAACTNFAGTLVVRILLGTFEAGYIPSLVIYLTTFYTRGELAKRIAAFYSCNTISGAFSGLLSYGIFQIESTRLKGWQILFILEGGLTIIFAVLVFICLPWSPSTAKFLTDREREVAKLRVLRDGSATTGTKFNGRAFLAPFKDWKFYWFATIGLCYGVGLTVAGNFLTQIIGRFKYSVVKTNLYTVAPYSAAAIYLFAVSYSSDRFRERGFHLAGTLTLVLIGCIILAAIDVNEKGVGYFATFLITMGSLTPSPLFHSWHQNNDATEDGRAARIGFYVFLGNFGGVVSANIFQEKWAPDYKIPLAITGGIQGLGIFLVVSMRLWMSRENRKRNKAQGVVWSSHDVPTEALMEGPANPLFRYFL